MPAKASLLVSIQGLCQGLPASLLRPLCCRALPVICGSLLLKASGAGQQARALLGGRQVAAGRCELPVPLRLEWSAARLVRPVSGATVPGLCCTPAWQRALIACCNATPYSRQLLTS